MRIHLVRHARPKLDGGVCYGSSDVEVAQEDNAALAQQLRLWLPKNVPLYSSPLQRCRTLADALKPNAIIDARLAEMHFGEWELRRWDAISRSEIDAWSADLAGYRPGGGESVTEAAQRVHAFLHDLRASGTQEAVIICHAGTIRLMEACIAQVHNAAPYSLHEIALAAAKATHAIDYGATLTLAC